MKNRVRLPGLIAMVAAVFWGLIEPAGAQFTFVTNNGAITITGYTGSSSFAIIPAITNGHPVTAIGNSAFGGDARLAGAVIPNSVTNIGASAFFGSGLTNIIIPASVIGIGGNAFASCNNLTNISVNATNPAYSSLNGVLFDKAMDTLIQYPINLTNSNYAVPGSVSTLADDAFYEASNVYSVTIPAHVSYVGFEAFASCRGLNSVYFGGNAPNVGSDAFYETDFGHGITVYYLPGTTGWAMFSSELGRSLSALATWYQANPEIINLGKQNGQFGFTISWATNATLVVNASSDLSNPVWLPLATNSVMAANGTVNFADPQWNSFRSRFYRIQLAPSPFAYTTMNGAITITGYTGSNPSVIIPATINCYPVVGIGNGAFGSNPGSSIINSVIIPDSVTNIGNEAFAGSDLTTITIPDSVTSIGQNAFAACYSLASINVSAGNSAYSSLGGVLFDKAQETLIQFPIGLTTNSYSIPATVTTIAENAFYGASGFASVTIPGSVTSIGSDAFAFCYAQNNNYLQVYFEGNAPSIGSFAFYNDGFFGFTGNYIPGTTGWKNFSKATSGSLASLSLWFQPQPMVLDFEQSFGMKNGQFGFTISWATNANVVVDACTNPANPVWLPISTNTLNSTTGTNNFSDPQSGNLPRRYYRLRSQ